ncbi:hypothetical protein DBR47_11160 [Paucibacter sp. KBW04]|nr:hypothetical protein DBR47_11160 [Paucibacter sp. KBW04]
MMGGSSCPFAPSSSMPPFDANTLMLVIAVFNGFMAFVWLAMGRLFRIAPQASLLLLAANLVSIPGLYCPSCSKLWPQALGPWMNELPLVISMALLALGVRKLMRLRFHFSTLGLLTAGAVLGSLLLSSLGQADAGLLVLSLCMSLLALTAFRDVLAGRVAEQPLLVTLLLCMPYALWALMMLGQALALSWLPQWREWFLREDLPSVPLAWTDLFIELCIGISLVGMVVARLIGRVKHMTLRDGLTDTLNRRALSAELRRLQAQVERGQSHCLVMIDVDHFKRINDQHGHACGDAALRHLVQVLRANMRALDQLGRMGGEEFCLLLPHTALADAQMVAERMAQALRSEPLLWQGQALTMTASFGVMPCLQDDPQGDKTLAMADDLLYRAKAQGRDRVCADAPELRAATL